MSSSPQREAPSGGGDGNGEAEGASSFPATRAAHDLRARLAAVAPHALFALVLVGLCGAYVLHVLRTFGGHTIDDAGITYAYADNLGRGHGLRLTPGEAPVEGFSNFLEVLLLAPVAAFVKQVDGFAKALNVVCVALALAGLCVLCYRRTRGAVRALALVPILLPFNWPGFSYWISAGLEGGLVCALQIGTVLLLAAHPPTRRTDLGLGAVAGLLAWSRPEGAVYGALAVAPRLLARRTPASRWVAPAAFAGLVALLLLTRLVLFRDVVPNTYWAKVHQGVDRMAGLRYVGVFIHERGWYFNTALPLVALFSPATRMVALAALAQLAFAFYFPVHVGGDWMREYRFMQAAMGPFISLCGLGVVAIAAPSPERPRWLQGARAQLLMVAVCLGPPLFAALFPPGWAERARQVNAWRDVDMKKIAVVGERYSLVGKWAKLQRRPLIADVDMGGMSYRTGIEVLDLGGLANRTMAKGWTRHAAVVPDYFFGERRPDSIHVHGGWFLATPVGAMSPFARDYRALAPPALSALSMAPLTAIRAELLDPPAAPRRRVALPWKGGAMLLGLSAVRAPAHHTVVVHARQTGAGHRPPLLFRGRNGARYPGAWHADVPLEPTPIGSTLLGLVRVPDGALPITLEGADLQIDEWAPLETTPAARTVEDLTRLPVLRLAEVPTPPCDPGPFLDPAADGASRARGVGFIAHLCNGLAPELRARWTGEVIASARQATDPDDRYDAAAAALAIGLPQTVALRALLESARDGHHPYDEVLVSWADQLLGVSLPPPLWEIQALRLLLAARRYEEVALRVLGRVITPETTGALCLAAGKLGLRGDRLGADVVCPGSTVGVPLVVRQSFEDPADPSLSFTPASRRWLTAAAHPGQTRVFGGQGRLFIDTFDTGPAGEGEVVWGPFRAPGRRFGALVAGSKARTLSVVVEARGARGWAEVARLPPPPHPTVMMPVRAELPGAGEVRVRIVDRDPQPDGYLLVDALTFIAD